ncbi:hypothetical protein ACFX13_006667 [Malus domestica]
MAITTALSSLFRVHIFTTTSPPLDHPRLGSFLGFCYVISITEASEHYDLLKNTISISIECTFGHINVSLS